MIWWLSRKSLDLNALNLYRSNFGQKNAQIHTLTRTNKKNVYLGKAVTVGSDLSFRF